MRSYAVIDPQQPGERITCHGYYLTRDEADYQSALRKPTQVIQASLWAWVRWRWWVLRGQV